VPALIEYYMLNEASGHAELVGRLRFTNLTLRIQQALEALDCRRCFGNFRMSPPLRNRGLARSP